MTAGGARRKPSRSLRSTRSRIVARKRKILLKKIKKFKEKHNLEPKVQQIMEHMHPSDLKKVLTKTFPAALRSADAFVISVIRRVETESGRASGYRWDGKTWSVSTSPRRVNYSSCSSSSSSESRNDPSGMAGAGAPWTDSPLRERPPIRREESASRRRERQPRSRSRLDSSPRESPGDGRERSGSSMSPARSQRFECSPSRPMSPKENLRRNRASHLAPLKAPTASAKSAMGKVKSCSLGVEARSRLKQFFDGTSMCEMLLEGSGVMQVPDALAPMMLNGYPHGFPNLSIEDGMSVLNVISAFVTSGASGGREAAGSETPDVSTEVRQALVVDASGRRVLRKTLLVNGSTANSEEQFV